MNNNNYYCYNMFTTTTNNNSNIPCVWTWTFNVHTAQGLSSTIVAFDETRIDGAVVTAEPSALSRRLVQFIVEDIRRRFGSDISGNDQAMRRLTSSCERAKARLLSSTELILQIVNLFNGIDYKVTITRARFEDLCQDSAALEFERQLLHFVVQNFNRRFGQDMSGSERSMRRLRWSCERVKAHLSSSTELSLEIDSLFNGIDYKLTIARAQFQNLRVPVTQQVRTQMRVGCLIDDEPSS
jgi:molecular chaperone DnaK (HSP70)